MKQKLIIIGPENLIETLSLLEALNQIPIEDLYFQTTLIITQDLQHKLNSIALQEGVDLIFLSLEDLHHVKQSGKLPKSIQHNTKSNSTINEESDILINLSLNTTFFEIFKKIEVKNKYGLRPSNQNKILMQTKWEHLLFAKYYSYVPFSFSEIFYQIIKDSFKKSYQNNKQLNDIFNGQTQIEKKMLELKIKEVLIDATSLVLSKDSLSNNLKDLPIKYKILDSAASYLFSVDDKIPEQTLVITDNYINSKLFQMQGHRVVCLFHKLSDFYNFSNYSEHTLNIYIPDSNKVFINSLNIISLINEQTQNEFINSNLKDGILFSKKEGDHFNIFAQELVDTEQVLISVNKVFWDFFLSNYTKPQKIVYSSQAICQELKKHIRDIKLVQVAIIEFMNYCLQEQGTKSTKHEILIREVNRHEEVIKLCAKHAHPFIQSLYHFNRAQMSNKNFDRPNLVVEFLILNYRELYSCYEAVEELLNLSLESHLSTSDNQSV